MLKLSYNTNNYKWNKHPLSKYKIKDSYPKRNIKNENQYQALGKHFAIVYCVVKSCIALYRSSEFSPESFNSFSV